MEMPMRTASPSGQSDDQVLVWFDGACPLCRREINLMRRLDRHGHIAFIDVADPATECPIDRQVLLGRFHAQENGKIYSGAAAFAALWRAIPLLRPIGELARLRPVLRMLDYGYGLFLNLRPLLQRAVQWR